MATTDGRPQAPAAEAEPSGALGRSGDPDSPEGSRWQARLPLMLFAVLALYGASAFLVPTLAPVGVSDDFLYARSVESLLDDGNIVILPAAAVTLVFQILWGALFQALFGESLGVLRVATFAFTFLGATALYGLCRELRLDNVRSAIGAAVFLFNPLGYVMSFTFMTDSYLVTLLTIAAYFYARGLRNEEPHLPWLLAGSAAAALAFLVRHQGILVAVSVLTYLWASGRLRRDRTSLRLALTVIGVPVATVVSYLVWFRFVHGVPEGSAQVNYFSALGDAGPSGIVRVARQLFFIELMFIGLFTLPLALSALLRVPELVRSLSRRAWLVFTAVALAGALGTIGRIVRMPHVSQFFNVRGLGPSGDLHGGRLPLANDAVWIAVTVACAVAAAVVLLSLCRRLHLLSAREEAAAGISMSVLAWQGAGVVAVSMILRDTTLSYDRYLLPLLPFAICVAMWGLRDVELNLPIAIAVTAGLAVYSIAGTHDFLQYQSATWQVARQANDAGVPYDQLEAGASWDGYHLYEYSYRNEIPVDFPLDFSGPLVLSENDVSPWWQSFYASAVRPDYVVSAEPLLSFTVVRRVEYSSWLLTEPTYMYLLRHPQVEGPP